MAESPNIDRLVELFKEGHASSGFRYLVHYQRDISSIRNGPVTPGPEVFAQYLLALQTEVSELAQELNWKPWKARKEVDGGAVMAEFADITAFYLLIADLLCQELGVTPDHLIQAYYNKSALNRQRLAGHVPGYEKEIAG